MSNQRLVRVQLSADSNDSTLMTEAEAATYAAARASQAAQPAEMMPEIPDFNAPDVALIGQGRAVAARPFWTSQNVLIAVCGLACAVLLVGLSIASSGSAAAPTVVHSPSPLAPTVAHSATVAARTAAPVALVAYFNYRDPATATGLTTADMERVTGVAGDGWRLVALTRGRGAVWVRSGDVPATLPADRPLPDLLPPTVAPTPSAGVVAATNSTIAQPTLPAECTPARWVAIVADERGYAGSCISVAAAQSLKPGAPVVAGNADEAAAWLSERSANDQHGAALVGLPTPTPMR